MFAAAWPASSAAPAGSMRPAHQRGSMGGGQVSRANGGAQAKAVAGPSSRNKAPVSSRRSGAPKQKADTLPDGRPKFPRDGPDKELIETVEKDIVDLECNIDFDSVIGKLKKGWRQLCSSVKCLFSLSDNSCCRQ